VKIEVITNEKSNLEFFIEGERHTLPNLLKEKLGQNTDVEFVAYRLEHPLDKKSRFVVKAKGNAKKAVEEAIKELQTDISEFKKAFEKVK
jgi:DNA-directed RNA polymerase subunit L